VPLPLPALSFDPEVEISPYELFRRLREGRAPTLYDLGGRARGATTLRGARAVRPGAGWTPPEAESVVFDDTGEGARALVVALRGRGVTGVRALFGGLRLYDYCLDPRVVGEDRYLDPRGSDLQDPG
jgi:hypothetical protein